MYDERIDFYGFLQQRCHNDAFYTLTKSLSRFRQTVQRGMWLRTATKSGAVLSPLAFASMEANTGRSFDRQHAISLSRIASQYSYLTTANAALIVACAHVEASCFADPQQTATEVLVLTYDPVDYLRREVRAELQQRCHDMAVTAAAQVVVLPFRRTSMLLVNNLATTLFNFVAPHMDSRARNQAERYRGSIEMIHEVMFLAPDPQTPRQSYYWIA